MNKLTKHPKITHTHLQRQAIIYLRQSTPKQVLNNQESQFNQRALVERAQNLGWHSERVRVMDGDLGQSAAQAESRDDFKALVAEIALGHVGIVFSWEVSRLARNNAEWYQLLDMAALFGTMIADVEGIYEPRLYNDRLLLGLKGTMSEAELHMMRQRLNAGRMSKVARGEYVQHLPTGLTRLSDKKVVKDPDEQIRHVIELIFSKFGELGSCQKVLRYLRAQGILVPRHQTNGFHQGEILWRKPSSSMILDMLKNPAYAGAFVYGRRPKDPTRKIPGRHSTGCVRKPMSEWQCIIHDTYPAYISWEQYLANQARIRENGQRFRENTQSRGVPRQGAALLQGLASCGECGRIMTVHYKSEIRYKCESMKKSFAEPMCVSLDGPSIDKVVVQAFFEAIQPAQLDALEALLAQKQKERDKVERYWKQQLQRVNYETHKARQRYEAVDPQNRLVAAELERLWEESLVSLQQAQEEFERFKQHKATPSLNSHHREQLEHISQSLPELWKSSLTNEHKKQLLRSLITRVILKRTAPDHVEAKIVWVSGHFSKSSVQPPIWRSCDITGYEKMVERIGELWALGQTDKKIATQLTKEGFRSARSLEVGTNMILKIRLKRKWYQPLHQSRGADELNGYLTVSGLAKQIGVKRDWIYNRLGRGKIEQKYYTREPQSGVYLIVNDPQFIESLRKKAKRKRRAKGGI